MRIKVGDEVQVMSGNGRGERGKVLRMDRKSERVIVEGVNNQVKNLKKTQQNPFYNELNSIIPKKWFQSIFRYPILSSLLSLSLVSSRNILT